MKICTKCNVNKPLENYYNSPTGKFGKNSWCKECEKIKRRNYVAKNPDLIRDRQLLGKRRSLYGLTQEQFEDIYKNQKGLCYICEEVLDLDRKGCDKRKCVVDHDHNTGEIRGLLCRLCNQGLGLFKDNNKILERAIMYLRKKNTWT